MLFVLSNCFFSLTCEVLCTAPPQLVMCLVDCLLPTLRVCQSPVRWAWLANSIPRDSQFLRSGDRQLILPACQNRILFKVHSEQAALTWCYIRRFRHFCADWRLLSFSRRTDFLLRTEYLTNCACWSQTQLTCPVVINPSWNSAAVDSSALITCRKNGGHTVCSCGWLGSCAEIYYKSQLGTKLKWLSI